MLINDIFSGQAVSLLEMLDAREKRQDFQYQLLKKYPRYSLLSISLNIPGEIKNSKILTSFFNEEVSHLSNLFDTKIVEKFIFNKNTGNEAYMVLKVEPLVLKKILIEFEESKEKRRLLDLDVIFLENNHLALISRTDLNIPSRKCLICQEAAKICTRSKKHSLEEIKQKISKLINQ